MKHITEEQMEFVKFRLGEQERERSTAKVDANNALERYNETAVRYADIIKIGVENSGTAEEARLEITTVQADMSYAEKELQEAVKRYALAMAEIWYLKSILQTERQSAWEWLVEHDKYKVLTTKHDGDSIGTTAIPIFKLKIEEKEKLVDFTKLSNLEIMGREKSWFYKVEAFARMLALDIASDISDCDFDPQKAAKAFGFEITDDVKDFKLSRTKAKEYLRQIMVDLIGEENATKLVANDEKVLRVAFAEISKKKRCTLETSVSGIVRAIGEISIRIIKGAAYEVSFNGKTRKMDFKKEDETPKAEPKKETPKTEKKAPKKATTKKAAAKKAEPQEEKKETK